MEKETKTSAEYSLEQSLQYYREKYKQLQEENVELTYTCARYRKQCEEMLCSTSWRVTRPLRAIKTAVYKIARSNRVLLLMWRGLSYLKNQGVVSFFKKLWTVVAGERSSHSELGKKLTKKQLEEQRARRFEKQICISILVPLYNTDIAFLREMLDSVVRQTYPNWQLCLADGSDRDQAEIEAVVAQYQKDNQRILYRVLEENRGISENTNACAQMATGDFLALLDHDDILAPNALFEIVSAYNETGAQFIYTDEAMFERRITRILGYNLKSDYAPDTLRSYNYICHLSCFDKRLFEQVGGFRSKCDGSQDYDLVLRITEIANHVYHIPKVLYYWRSHPLSVASDISAKPYCLAAARTALADHLARVGLEGTVEDSTVLSTYKIRYALKGTPLISILIPNCDHVEDLRLCVNSILGLSTYENYEIIVIENNSIDPETFRYYAQLEKSDRVQVVYWKDTFNYSAINNFGFQYAKGEYILLLNNDMEVISPDWMQEMLMFAQRDDVGAVGAKLYYPDDTVQHAGVILGIGGVAGHALKGSRRDEPGFMTRLQIAQDLSAVTAACMMIPRRVYQQVHGLDEGFEVAFNDVDLCMRIRQAGYLIVFTPYAELYHYESKSRGYEDTKEKQMRFSGEVKRFTDRWQKQLDAGDPYYNSNLTLKREDFSLR